MDTFRLQCIRDCSFEISLNPSLLHDGDDGLSEVVSGRKLLVITSRTVAFHYLPAVRILLRRYTPDVSVQVLDLPERAKAPDTLLQICQSAREHKMDRSSVLVALGGGVCSDVTGCAASMIRRGIAHIRIPTTLLAMVDAAVGLKCGVNLDDGKNYLGSFFPPKRVFVDPSFLATLPVQHLRQGLSEIVKIALVRDQELFFALEATGRRMLSPEFFVNDEQGRCIIERAIALMVEELGKNPFEQQDLRRLVDFGHTFSPTLEALTNFAMPHGDAVAVDMVLTAEISHHLGLLCLDDLDRLYDLLSCLDLPVCSLALDERACRRAVADAMLHRGGRVNLVVPTGIGCGSFVESPEAISAVIQPSLLAVQRRAGVPRRRIEGPTLPWRHAS